MFSRGGNAVDAVVAAAFAAFVYEPSNCGLGGYGHLALFRAECGEFVTIDHSCRAPRGARADMFALEHASPDRGHPWPDVVGRANEVGHLAPAVPGAVSGLCAAHELAGRLPLAQVLAPAVEAADAGLEVTWDLALVIVERLDAIRATREAADYLLPNGRIPRAAGYSGPGDRLDMSALAATLRRIAEQGPRAFYSGPVAAAIEGAVAAGGGILTAHDLEAYRPKILREPPGAYRRYAYVTANDQVGYETLNILERFPLRGYDPCDARFLHLMAEAFGHAFVDNVTHSGDPDHVASPVEGLASREFAAARAAGISLERAAPRPIAPADPWPFDGTRAPEGAHRDPSAGIVTGTSQVAAADADGNAAALITTIGNDFGSLVLIPECGVFLNSGMANFDPRPHRPNSASPGKMPFFAVPAIVAARDGRAVFAAGGSGGYRILSGVVHAFVNALDLGLDVRTAVSAPRVYCQGEVTFVDERVPEAVRTKLKELGHTVVAQSAAPAFDPFARVSAVTVDRGGVISGSSDPVWSGGAAAA
jgi:gamma-glutamyltranspeptidase/glutathione hydrolase